MYFTKKRPRNSWRCQFRKSGNIFSLVMKTFFKTEIISLKPSPLTLTPMSLDNGGHLTSPVLPQRERWVAHISSYFLGIVPQSTDCLETRCPETLIDLKLILLSTWSLCWLDFGDWAYLCGGFSVSVGRRSASSALSLVSVKSWILWSKESAYLFASVSFVIWSTAPFNSSFKSSNWS